VNGPRQSGALSVELGGPGPTIWHQSVRDMVESPESVVGVNNISNESNEQQH